MTKIRLEINQFNIDRPKKRWKIYFVIIAEHPTEADKMVVSTIPSEPVRITPNQNNEVHFSDEQPGNEGLFLLQREMPLNRELNVHCYVRHSRSSIRNIGEILKNIKSEIGGDLVDGIANITSTVNPILVIAKETLPLVGKVLSGIHDRDMGFISMFERFGSEFEEDEEIDRKKTGGFSTIVYTWSVDRE